MTATDNPLEDCRAARLPLSALAVLAPLRRMTGVRIVETADAAWVMWDGSMPKLVETLLPAGGGVLYRNDGGNWRPIRSALPDFVVPLPGVPIAISRSILPDRVQPTQPPVGPVASLEVMLVPCERPRPVSAIRCKTSGLQILAERATTAELQQLSGIACGDTTWLRGKNLPVLAESERFWGERVLVPVGLRPEPDWSEGPLRLAAQVNDDEILVLSTSGTEALPAGVFRPLTRTAIRKLLRH